MKYYFAFFLSILLFACEWEANSNHTTNNITNGNANTETTNKHTPKNITVPKKINIQWLSIPGKQVGMITGNSSEVDIIKAYGKENVIRKTIGMGEGETAEATIVFPDTPNELVVEWEMGQAFKKPHKIRIEKNNTNWTTHQGIGIGTTLAELQRINGKDFRFAGFEWDYAGYSNDWQGGKIDQKLAVFLEANNPEAIYPDLVGDGLFSSDHPKAKAADLKVRAIVIEL